MCQIEVTKQVCATCDSSLGLPISRVIPCQSALLTHNNCLQPQVVHMSPVKRPEVCDGCIEDLRTFRARENRKSTVPDSGLGEQERSDKEFAQHLAREEEDQAKQQRDKPMQFPPPFPVWAEMGRPPPPAGSLIWSNGGRTPPGCTVVHDPSLPKNSWSDLAPGDRHRPGIPAPSTNRRRNRMSAGRKREPSIHGPRVVDVTDENPRAEKAENPGMPPPRPNRRSSLNLDNQRHHERTAGVSENLHLPFFIRPTDDGEHHRVRSRRRRPHHANREDGLPKCVVC